PARARWAAAPPDRRPPTCTSCASCRGRSSPACSWQEDTTAAPSASGSAGGPPSRRRGACTPSLGHSQEENLMDAIQLLISDHQTVEKLFTEFERLEERDASPKQLRKVVDRIIRELAVHSVIEEAIFYPAVRAAAKVVE